MFKYITKLLATIFALIAFHGTAFGAFSNVDCTNAADRLVLGGGTTELLQADCEFLEDVYTDTAPAGWTNNTGWDTLSDINSWHGLARTVTGRLRIIDLTNNNLVGDATTWVLPTAVTDFSLQNNGGLTGDVTSWILPTTLETFELRTSAFTGDISAWDLSTAPALIEFAVDNNNLTGDITGWIFPAGLLSLLMGNNNLSGDISGWSLPNTVTTIRLNNNNLTGDISGFSVPTSTLRIRLYNNDFTGSIPDVSSATSLIELSVYNNNLTGSIPDFTPNTALDRFLAQNNAFSGDVPDTSSWPALAVGSVSRNQLTAASAADDSAFDAWIGNDWSSTQTVAPTNASSTSQTVSEVIVSVDPYEYNTTGSFNLIYGTAMGGPYSTGTTTVARSAGNDIAVAGLTPNTVYYGLVEAFTPANSGGNVFASTSNEFIMILSTVPDLTTASDSGISTTDNITDDTTPTLEGSCVTGATVSLYINGTATGDTAACAGGVYAITPAAALPEGTHTVATTQTVAGEEASLSPALSVVIDETDPILSATVDTTAGVDDPTVSWTILETGSGIDRIEVTYVPDNGAAGVAATTTDVLAAAATDIVLDLDPDELTHEVIVRVYDVAGNVSEVTLRFPPLIAITAPTVVSSSTISDTTFTVTSPAGNDLENIASTLGTVDCNGSGNGTGPFSSPVSCTLTGIAAAGTAVITAEDVVTAATGENSQTYVVDNTPPVITTLDDVAVGPVMADDFSVDITDLYPATTTYEYGFSTDATCDINDTYGNALTSGATVTFSNESQNGNYVCVKAEDIAGNVTYVASANPLNIDTTDPVVTLDEPGEGDTVFASGNPASPAVTVSGTGENGDSVTVTDGNGNTCNTTVVAGTWSCDIPVTVGGSTTFTVTETDPAGNTNTDTATVLVYLDTDGDGHPDDVETPAGSNPNDETSTPADTDGDGVPDQWESNFASPSTDPNDNTSTPADTDGDGHPDYTELAAGSDPNNPASTPTDTDGDQVPDWVEVMQGTDPNSNTDFRDQDGDRVPDYVESQDGTDATDGTEYRDTDGDLVPDYIEVTLQVNEGGSATDENDDTDFLDTDSGGVPDYVEVTRYVNEGLSATDPNVIADDTRDTDGGGISDYDELKNATNPSVRDGSEISSGGSGGGGTRYYCRDENAINYSNRRGREDNGLCKYATTTTSTENTAVEDLLDQISNEESSSDFGNMKPRFTKNLSTNAVNNNDPIEVNKVVAFLNDTQGENLALDGSYDTDDIAAIKRFQNKYKDDVLSVWGLDTATGYVGITTRLKMNLLYNNINVSCPAFTQYNSRTLNTNSAEVLRTEQLLSSIGFFSGTPDTIWDNQTHTAMITFQETFRKTMLEPWGLSRGTGYKYKTTNYFLNFLSGCKSPSVSLENGNTVSY